MFSSLYLLDISLWRISKQFQTRKDVNEVTGSSAFLCLKVLVERPTFLLDMLETAAGLMSAGLTYSLKNNGVA